MRQVVHMAVAWWGIPDMPPVVVVQVHRTGLKDALRARLAEMGYDEESPPRVIISRHYNHPQAGCWVQEEEEIGWP